MQRVPEFSLSRLYLDLTFVKTKAETFMNYPYNTVTKKSIDTFYCSKREKVVRYLSCTRFTVLIISRTLHTGCFGLTLSETTYVGITVNGSTLSLQYNDIFKDLRMSVQNMNKVTKTIGL